MIQFDSIDWSNPPSEFHTFMEGDPSIEHFIHAQDVWGSNMRGTFCVILRRRVDGSITPCAAYIYLHSTQDISAHAVVRFNDEHEAFLAQRGDELSDSIVVALGDYSVSDIQTFPFGWFLYYGPGQVLRSVPDEEGD